MAITFCACAGPELRSYTLHSRANGRCVRPAPTAVGRVLHSRSNEGIYRTASGGNYCDTKLERRTMRLLNTRARRCRTIGNDLERPRNGGLGFNSGTEQPNDSYRAVNTATTGDIRFVDFLLHHYPLHCEKKKLLYNPCERYTKMMIYHFSACHKYS
ncbi:hypothetical protein EVAR_57792_1 [Eumeta japonica]|uniref:Uncharacterized protein n=1 Tax=Eumeta variegata TaxID=151549 RepID=A0A4C1Y7Y9_EUMVA|nr:hypothetical protein EVAR_57792_1 [Eumeta japonica]